MGAAPTLFCREEIAEGVVVRASSDDILTDSRTIAVGKLTNEGPSVFEQTRCIGSRNARLVVSVCARHTYLPTFCIAGCIHLDIGGLSKASKREIGGFQRVDHFFISAGIVQAAK